MSGCHKIGLPIKLILVVSLDTSTILFFISSGIIYDCQSYSNIPAIASSDRESHAGLSAMFLNFIGGISQAVHVLKETVLS